MCGLFGWSGKDPKKFNKTKLDILGIFNEERGTHSCGISSDGDIFIGIDKNKVYKDFLVNANYDVPFKYPSVIGHTRLATGGAHTVHNAHPFGFGNLDDNYEFIGVHNGTLVNHKDLAKKYNIELTESIEENNVTTIRNKIDSEILLECIYKSQSFKVLDDYNGAAALVFTNLNEPNVVYYYHGSSKKLSTDNGSILEEERPLFYYQESKNSLYVSSIKESLYAIDGNNKTIGEFDTNIVYKVTDGDLSTAIKFKVNRTGNFQKEGYTTYTSHKSSRRSSYNRYYDMMDDDDWTVPYSENKNQLNLNNDLPSTSQMNLDVNIYTEKQLKENYGNSIYFNKLRYWRNGHLITGCYTYVEGFGFYPLGRDIKESESKFWTLVNKSFFKDDFSFDVKKLNAAEVKQIFTPFYSTASSEIVEPVMYYFYNGVRITTRLDYLGCINMEDNGVRSFEWDALSLCSAHPVINNIYHFKPARAQEVYLDGSPFTDTICPLGSEKIYTFVGGNCTKIEPIKIVADKLIEIVNELDAIEDAIIESEAKDKKKETKVVPLYNIEDDLLEDTINEVFKDSLRQFPSYIKRLEKFPNIKRSKVAIGILEEFIRKSTNLIAIEIND